MDKDQINIDIASKLLNLKKSNVEVLGADILSDFPIAHPSKVITSNSNQESTTSLDLPKKPKKSGLLIDKVRENDIRKLTISNCKDLNAALKFMVSQIIREEQENLESVLHIRFKVEHGFEDIAQNEIDNLSRKFGQKSLVVYLESSDNRKFFILWKSRQIQNFLTLKPYCENTSKNDKKIYKFVADFLATSLKIGHLGIHKNYSNKPELRNFELFFLADSRNHNLLLLAAEIGEAEIVESLLAIGMDTSIPQNNINAQSLAWNGRHSNVLMVLIQANLTYPKSFEISHCSQELKRFYNKCIELHDAVKMNNKEKILNILDHYPKIQYFYNSDNESVAKIAIANKCIKSYKLLLDRKILLAPHEQFEDITENLEYEDKRSLREIHFEHKKDLPEKHLNILRLNSFVSHDVEDVQDKIDLVMKAYKFLNQSIYTRIILLIVAASKNFKIIYDFNRDSVNVADPTVSSNTQGLFYLSGRIYIGAKQLLDKATEKEAYATLAHEFCHYAMHLVYGNDANPYKRTDLISKLEFEKISQKCQKNSDKEDVVYIVYELYPEEMYHAELIVRIPHMLTLYHDQPEKIQETKETFPELYEHYEKKIIPEMTKAIPEIETRDEREVSAKNKKILSLKKKYKLVISLSLLTLVALMTALAYVVYEKYIKTQSFQFDSLSSEEKAIVYDSRVIYKTNSLILRNLFPNEHKFYSELTQDHYDLFKNKNKLDLSDKIFSKVNTTIFTNWEDMPEVLKDIFLNSSFSFQGVDMKFEKFNILNPKIFTSLSEQQFNDIFDGKSLNVSKELKLELAFYLERSFMKDNESKTENLLPINQTISSQELVNLTAVNKAFVLYSEPGEGKTTVLQHLSVKIKHTFPDKWVCLVYLKEHIKIYNDNGSIIDFRKLMNETCGLKNEIGFGKEIFLEYFKMDKVVFIWDGFDEVSKFKTFILNVLRYIRVNTKNVQFIGTNPLYKDELIKNLQDNSTEKWMNTINTELGLDNGEENQELNCNPIIFRLNPFTGAEQDEYLTKSFISKKVAPKNIGKVMTNVKQLMERLKVNAIFDTSFRAFDTPFLLGIFIKAYESNLLNSGNLYAIFENVLKKDKKLYQKQALKAELANTNSIVFLKLSNYEIFKVLDQNLVDSGNDVLHKKTNNSYEFSHKSLSEFYVAQYLIDNVYNYCTHDDQEAELRLELFFYVVKSYGYFHYGIVDFMNDYLKLDRKYEISDENLYYSAIPVILKDNFEKFFINLLNTKYPKIFEFLFNFFGRNCEVLQKLTQIDETETFYTSIFNPIYGGFNINPFEIKFDQKCFSSSGGSLDKLKIGKNQKGIKLLGNFVRKNYAFISNVEQDSSINLKAFNEISFWKITNVTFKFLENDEKIQLCKVLLNPKLYFSLGFENMIYYYDIWTFCEVLYTEVNDMLIILGQNIANLLETDLNRNLTAKLDVINFYIHKIKMFLFLEDEKENPDFIDSENSDQTKNQKNDSKLSKSTSVTKIHVKTNNFDPKAIVYEIFQKYFILHKSARCYSAFKLLWNFFTEHTDEKQKLSILRIKDDGEFYHFYDFQHAEISQYYDGTEMSIFQRGLLATGTDKNRQLDLIKEIYSNVSQNFEISDYIRKDKDFILYILQYSNEDFCYKVADYFNKLFGNRNELNGILSHIKTRVAIESNEILAKNWVNFLETINFSIILASLVG